MNDPFANTPGIGEARDVFRGMLTNDRVNTTLAYLWGRWQDEHEYEDFNDYAKQMDALVKSFNPKVKLVKATKRPFEVYMLHNDCPTVTFALKVTGQGLSLRSLGKAIVTV